MRLPDPIAPYASLLKWGLILATCAALFVGGCVRGVESGKASQAKAVDKAEASAAKARDEAAEYLRAANACGNLVGDISRETQRQVDEAENRRRAAEEAAERAEAERKTAAKKQAAAEKALDAAKKDPACADQLRMPLCPAIPLL